MRWIGVLLVCSIAFAARAQDRRPPVSIIGASGFDAACAFKSIPPEDIARSHRIYLTIFQGLLAKTPGPADDDADEAFLVGTVTAGLSHCSASTRQSDPLSTRVQAFAQAKLAVDSLDELLKDRIRPPLTIESVWEEFSIGERAQMTDIVRRADTAGDASEGLIKVALPKLTAKGLGHDDILLTATGLVFRSMIEAVSTP